MRVRLTLTALGLTGAALALPACSAGTSQAKSASPSSAPAGHPAAAKQGDAPLSSAALQPRLLDESDLGPDYTRKPEDTSSHDDVTVTGCPALEKLGGDAAAGGSLDFPHKAKASFTYTGGSGGSEVSEELYSDTSAKLSDGIGRIFSAMTGCPTYQVVSGSTAINVTSQKTAAPRLGDEQWSQLMTFSAGGQDSVVKQTAIREGRLLLVVSGAPALVD
ncbi:hypothetical protein LKL35_12275 [Streptomyces sp. ET3-23]|uniref:hypothetical protein n=1 Tax=Streptomyces sp. ET3-23 TaxID=2885643 RepID=UPI001D1128CA|nr:hypothetical protein [Streptomyces sp. ET3-23]MCC2276186.1 hypothetical protein [Streptomyces sp. ET3-23]